MVKKLRNFVWGISDYVLEVLILGFGIFAIFPHLQKVINSTPSYTFRDTLHTLRSDVMNSPWAYGLFLGAALLWGVVKYYRRKADEKERTTNNDRLNKLTSAIEQLIQRMDDGRID